MKTTTKIPGASLPPVTEAAPRPDVGHFPSALHAAVWRNWDVVDVGVITAVLDGSVEDVTAVATSMGLPAQRAIPDRETDGNSTCDYPVLANLPQEARAGGVFSNGIYGVPFLLLPLQTRPEARTDLVEGLGEKAEAASAEEFLDLCRAITDAKARRWALVRPITNALKTVCASSGSRRS